MSPFHYDWVRDLLGWGAVDSEVRVQAALLAVAIVAVVCGVLYEMGRVLIWYANWWARASVSNRRRLRVIRERERQWTIVSLRRQLAKLEDKRAD